MNNKHLAFACTFVVAAFAAASCHDGSAPPDAGDPGLTQSLGGGAGGGATWADQVCPGTRMVGRVSSGDCPDAPSGSEWVEHDLFAGPAAGNPRLKGYCLYEWQGKLPPTDPQIAVVQNLRPGEWLDRDCMAVTPAGPAEDALGTLQPTYQEFFFEQLGATTALGAGIYPVRVAVIDSRPEVLPSDPSDQLGHGLGMTSIIENLTCDRMAGPCPITLRPQLALNLIAPDKVDPVDGGYFGYQGHLARQIVQAVTSWKAAQPNANLVINLSLGWDPDYSQGSAHPTSKAVEAVHRAIEFATCSGAAVFAAAGNDGGAGASSGPVEPAAWATETVVCGGSTRRLLHAVGGVDGTDAALYNVRPQSRPQLAAPAFMVLPEHSSRLVGPFTGSSPAAAVASAAAAILWSQDDTLTAAEVVDTIFATAEILPDLADVCTTPPCNIGRISLCRVAEAAYGTPTLGCDTPAAEAGTNVTLDQIQADYVASLTTAWFGGECGASYVPNECTNPVKPLIDSSQPIPPPVPSWYLCADEHLPLGTALAIVGPETGVQPCGACTYDMTAVDPLIHLGVSTRVRGSIYPTTLKLLNRAGDVVDTIDLTLLVDVNSVPLIDGLTGGDVAEVVIENLERVSFHSATVTWLTDLSSPRTAIESPLTVR